MGKARQGYFTLSEANSQSGSWSMRMSYSACRLLVACTTHCKNDFDGTICFDWVRRSQAPCWFSRNIDCIAFHVNTFFFMATRRRRSHGKVASVGVLLCSSFDLVSGMKYRAHIVLIYRQRSLVGRSNPQRSSQLESWSENGQARWRAGPIIDRPARQLVRKWTETPPNVT